MNDYLIHRVGDVPRVAWEGMVLWWRWPNVPGALALCVAAFRAARRQVSISVRRSPEDLTRFVRSPNHLRIMREYRGTGTLYTHAWTADQCDRRMIWEECVACLHGLRMGVRHH
jgi:hypothetical protein